MDADRTEARRWRGRHSMTVSSPLIAPGLRHRVADHAASGALRDLLEHLRLSYAPEPLSEGAIFGFSGALDLRVRIADAAVPGDRPRGSRALAGARALRAPRDPRAVAHDVGPGDRLAAAARRAGRGPPRARARRPRRARLPRRRPPRHAPRDPRDERRPRRGTSPGSPTEASPSRSAAASPRWPPRARRRAGRSPPTTACWRSACARTGSPTRAPPSRPRWAASWRRCAGRRAPTIRTCARASTPPTPSPTPGPDCPTPPVRGSAVTLEALRFRIRDGGTGGALYRSLQARFLHEAAALLGSPQLGHAALVCDDLADAWRALAGAIDGDDPVFAHRVSGPWVQRIRALEHQHVEALEEHLACHEYRAA